MHCASCSREVAAAADQAFTGDVCPHCRRFAHPTRLGEYQDLELVERGGMGAVYAARHPRVGTKVAIKVVHSTIGPDGLAARFDREARIAARIAHPGVVPVYDYDAQEGRLYLVMEFVAGQTLRQAAQDGPREIAWCIDKVSQLADVLDAAHGQGVVHRDVKPENVMVDATGRVRVLDFGISRLLESEDRLTRTGEILGTPEYVAPEQILDVPEAVDARTDVYAAGVVLYELLTGRSPFAGSNLLQVLRHVESRTPPAPSTLRAEVSGELDDLVLTAMAKDPDDRPASCREFARRLRALTPPDGARMAAGGLRRQRPAVVGLVGATVGLVLGLVVGLLVGLALRSEPETTPTRDGASVQRERTLAAARALLRAGAWGAARTSFEAAAAPVGAAIASTYADRLLAAVLPDGMDWLGPSSDAPDSVLPGDAPSDDAQILRALEALERGDRAGAAAALEPLDANRDVHVALLGAALAPVAERAGLLQTAADRIDRAHPERYLVELVAALHQRSLPRLRATAELASVTGDSTRAMAFYLAGRAWLGRDGSLSPDDARGLLGLAEGLDPHGAPGIARTRALLLECERKR